MVEVVCEPLQLIGDNMQTENVMKPKCLDSQEDDLAFQKERLDGPSLRSEETGLLRQLLENSKHLKYKYLN